MLEQLVVAGSLLQNPNEEYYLQSVDPVVVSTSVVVALDEQLEPGIALEAIHDKYRNGDNDLTPGEDGSFPLDGRKRANVHTSIIKGKGVIVTRDIHERTLQNADEDKERVFQNQREKSFIDPAPAKDIYKGITDIVYGSKDSHEEDSRDNETPTPAEQYVAEMRGYLETVQTLLGNQSLSQEDRETLEEMETAFRSQIESWTGSDNTPSEFSAARVLARNLNRIYRVYYPQQN